LLHLDYQDSFTRSLPADPEDSARRRQVLRACFSRIHPTPVNAPRLLAYSAPAAELIGLAPSECESPLFVEIFSGNRVLGAMRPYAACYGGHQFGNWAGQLGDGRAITLAEVRTARGERWELQLKGAGPTPYSRTADGRAVVRSSLREFLCSEAMHHLGVPTTRALSLIATGESVLRDMFYDGHPKLEPGAVVCRMAPSFLRFGNFEIFTSRRDEATLRALAEYTLRELFPELLLAAGAPAPDVYASFFSEVCRRTAVLVAHWMRVGFVHGVMNTDNMSILGLTIDYGPYGWLDDFDPNWTPNTTDRNGRRYRYGHQPGVALWNLSRLAEALWPLVGAEAPLQAGLDVYEQTLRRALHGHFLAKLGFRPEDRAADTNEFPSSAERGDPAPLGIDLGDGLLDELLRILQLEPTDMTLFFRLLADVPADRETLQRADAELLAPLHEAFYAPQTLHPNHQAQLAVWLRAYLGASLARDLSPNERRKRMHAVNPRFVLRNYLAQLAIDEVERGETAKLEELLAVLRQPYDEQPDQAHLAEKRPDWARNRPGCSMLSCSS
ncbi:MAG TPA: YdiU family protein, partial [Polyangiaceae bacterium]|nr:YdiU family protein [Polyangiaceae bacterium]